MKLVEELSGVGAIRFADRRITSVPYRISRFQGMHLSGLPIPGLHRIEGNVTLAGLAGEPPGVGQDFTLELEDGRSLALTLSDEAGRVLAEGHGPGRGCACC